MVVDDATVWPTADNPLAKLAPYVEQADTVGLHLIAAADIRNWSFQTSGSSVLGRVVGSLPPVVILDGRRENGTIISGVFAEAQTPRQGDPRDRLGHRQRADRADASTGDAGSGVGYRLSKAACVA